MKQWLETPLMWALSFCVGLTVCLGVQDQRSGKHSQDEEVSSGKSERNSAQYSYEFNQPEFNPSRILIKHDDSGAGRITFQIHDIEAPLTDPIEISPTALTRIIALWKDLGYLDSGTVYQSAKEFPHLGTTRLQISRGELVRVAEFNWTEDHAAFALVNEYRRLADQAFFVLQINTARQNQPLETPKLLDGLELLFGRAGLSDAHQLLPLLNDLSTDERLPLIARNHANRLMRKIEKTRESGAN